MLLFWGVFLLLSLFTLLESLNKKLISTWVSILLFIILTLSVGLRPPLAVSDYEVYVFLFQFFGPPADYFTDFLFWAIFEPMYYLIPSVLHYVFHLVDYVSVSMWVYAILGTGIVMLALHKVSAFYYTSLLTLFSYYFLLHQFTQIRAAVAVGFLLLAVYYRYWKNTRALLACIILSLLFHYSSILGVVLFFLPARSINRKLWMSLAVVAFFISFFNFSSVLSLLTVDVGSLSDKQEAYVNNIVDIGLNRRNLMYILILINALVVIYYSHSISAENPYIYLFVKIQVVGLLWFQVFSASPVLAARGSEYFLVSHLVCFPAVLHLFKNRFWPALFFCLLMAAILFFFLHINKLIKLEYYGF